MVRKRKKCGGWNQILEEMIDSTRNQLKELSFSYEKLGQTLNKMPACQWSIQEEDIFCVIGRLSMDACEGCENFYQCYRQEKEQLMKEVRDRLTDLEKYEPQKMLCLSQDFSRMCLRREQVLRVLQQTYEIVELERTWKNKMLYQRKLLASQMEEMSRFLFDCSSKMRFERKKDEKLEGKLRTRLKKEKIRLESISIYENAGKKKEVYFIGRKKGGSCTSEYVAKLLGEIIGVPLVPARDCKMALYTDTTFLHFKEEECYKLLSGMAYKRKNGEAVSGDLFSILKLNQGKQVYLLVDGMGSGVAARKEGSRMVELIEQLLNTGFREEETLRLVNSTFTFGLERNMYSSIDFLSVNLYTGLLKIIKSGSAATFLLRKNRVEVIKSKNLPAGILWEVEFDVVYKKLYDGDKVVLVSDGVLDCFCKEEPEEEFKENLTKWCEGNPQQAAEQILEQAFIKNGACAPDDMTVIVLSVWKNNSR